MILETLVSLFARPFGDIYRFFDQYLVTNILSIARGFEVAIVLMVAMMYLLITVGITIRQVKRLPRSYSIQILDLDGSDPRLTVYDRHSRHMTLPKAMPDTIDSCTMVSTLSGLSGAPEYFIRRNPSYLQADLIDREITC